VDVRVGRVSASRWLALQMGRACLGWWVRAAAAAEPRLASDARRRFDRMATRVAWPHSGYNQGYLVFVILPMGALYAELRGRGWDEPDAVAAVRAASIAAARPLRRVAGLSVRTTQGRRDYVAGLGDMFPAPEWGLRWVEHSDTRARFDVTRCYVLDTLRELDAAPVAVAFCAFDTAFHDGMCPHLRFSRTQTLAAGADRCDWCVEIMTPDRPLATSRA
jgi:hypothetical protein